MSVRGLDSSGSWRGPVRSYIGVNGPTMIILK
jgi:hypothetical protein